MAAESPAERNALKNDVNSFFGHIMAGEYHMCHELLATLAFSQFDDVNINAWIDYLSAVLLFEEKQDFAQAETIFLKLAYSDLDDSELQNSVHRGLGRVYQQAHQWALAIAQYQASQTAWKATGDPMEACKDRRQIAICHYEGYMHGDLDKDALNTAEAECKQLLAQLDAITDEPGYFRGRLWLTLGSVHFYQQRWQDACNAYAKGLMLAAPTDFNARGSAYNNLGEAQRYLLGPGAPAALQSFEAALELYTVHRSPWESVDPLANLGYFYWEKGVLATADHYYRRALAIINATRGQVSTAEARASVDVSVAMIYANMVLLALDRGQPAEAFGYSEQARARVLLDLLGHQSDSSNDIQPSISKSPLTVQEIQMSLPADALLISYFTIGLVEAPSGRLGRSQHRHRMPDPAIIAFCIDANSLRVERLNLSPNALLPHRLDRATERHFLTPTIGQLLHAELLAPFRGKLAGKRTLYIVPHGPLHYVPFHALPFLAQATGQIDVSNWLADDPAVAYAPSASILCRSHKPGFWQKPDLSVLALGYNSDGERQLTFAETEARLVAKRFGAAPLVHHSDACAQLFIQAPDHAILHLAGHGRFDPDNPTASTLEIGPDELLTVQSIADNLRTNARLVTLSACESGLSRVRRGDELFGFVRAFMQAGASQLLVTLWRTDDVSALLLMDAFYRELRTGKAPINALHQAQTILRTMTHTQCHRQLAAIEAFLGQTLEPRFTPEQMGQSHPFATPFYWAAYILIGEGGL